MQFAYGLFRFDLKEGAQHSNDYATLAEQYAAEISKLDEHCKVGGARRPRMGFRV